MSEAADEYGVCDEGLSFDDLFARYHAPIYAYLLHMVGDMEQARNVTQDAFLTAYNALSRRPDPMPGWLYRIATHLALDTLRRRGRFIWLPFAFTAKDCRSLPDPSPLGQCASAETVGTVRHALAHLSPRQRACLLLHAREGLSIAEVAYALGTSEANVARTLRQAKERFHAAEHISWDRRHCDRGGGTGDVSRLQ